ncbi:methylenetetrahydrofolate reductase [Acidobacteria bacterium AH-259-G07]|nr:methylenetetrahydrofolate reductase [Acidobacteria bacterium AH-259-G07]
MKVVFEIFPSEKLKLDAIPKLWDLTFTCRAETIQPTMDTYLQLGSRHTPHLSTGLIQSEDHLRAIAKVVTGKVFLIAGDQKPIGPFERCAQVIPYFDHCSEIGVASYPEGHPSYPDQSLGDEILVEKQSLGATYAVTQMCFNPQAIIDWTKRIRDKGITLSIQCGVASPINVVKLTQFAMRCGVNTSLNFLKKMSTRDVVSMISCYDPRPLMEAVYDHVDGFHIYTFNAIKTTSTWLEQTSWLNELVYPEVVQLL